VAQCCTDDPKTKFTFNENDSTPLTALFDSTTGTVSIDPTGGALGHGSLRSDSYDSTFVKQFTTLLDECDNPRQDFALGGYFNFDGSDFTSPRWHLFELRNSAIPESLLSLWRDNNDLLVIVDSGGPDELEIFRVYNVVYPDQDFKIEIRGAINSISTSGDAPKVNSDGWIEVRVNKRVFTNFENAGLVKPDTPENDCPVSRLDVTFITSAALTGLEDPTGGWDIFVVSPMVGDLSCLYVKEDASFCNENDIIGVESAGSTCDPPGPGGSSFDGSPNGPRLIHTGGYPASYSAPTGGGIPATAADVSDPQ
jgi:hypothetical protein